MISYKKIKKKPIKKTGESIKQKMNVKKKNNM